MTRTAFVDGWGDTQYCNSDPQPEDFAQPLNGNYDCGSQGCSYSAYVSDHNCTSLNYCFR